MRFLSPVEESVVAKREHHDKAVSAMATVTVYLWADGTCHLHQSRDAGTPGNAASAVAQLTCPVEELDAVLAKFESICCPAEAKEATKKAA